MIAYHGNQQIKDKVLADLAKHAKADRIVQGYYWDSKNYSGCAVGCLTQKDDGGHYLYPELFGLPVQFAHLEDAVFEGLPSKLAKEWPTKVMAAVPVGAVLDQRWFDQLAVARLIETVLPLQDDWHDAVKDVVVAAVGGVVVALESGQQVRAARNAAFRAADAAYAAAGAADDAAYAAARAADAAAYAAAYAVADAAAADDAAYAADAVGAAAWEAEADRIIRHLEQLPESGTPNA